MRYLSLLPLLFLMSCSSTNGPEDVVETIKICRDCGDGRTIVFQYDNGQPLPFIDPIADGSCEELRVSEYAIVDLTGSDTLELNWAYQGDPVAAHPVAVHLSESSFNIACP